MHNPLSAEFPDLGLLNLQDGVMQLSRAQYEALFEGLDWRRMVAKPVVAPAAAG
jgi:hypothetical protein